MRYCEHFTAKRYNEKQEIHKHDIRTHNQTIRLKDKQLDKHETVVLFRARLGEIIARSDLKLSAFARKAGIDRSTLSQILSPATVRLPRVETLTAIAQTEQVSIDWLVGLSQEGGLRADIVNDGVEIQPGGESPADERLAAWHAEAVGYKIRSVPTTLPDLLKTNEVLEHEYRLAARTTPEQRREVGRKHLDFFFNDTATTEICTPLQALESLAHANGIWSGLTPALRRRQLEQMCELVDELYPTFRWFLYDARNRFSVPLTIFGPKRAAIYLGQRYLVLNSREQIATLTAHFDDLIRAAVVQPTEVPRTLQLLLEEV